MKVPQFELWWALGLVGFLIIILIALIAHNCRRLLASKQREERRSSRERALRKSIKQESDLEKLRVQALAALEALDKTRGFKNSTRSRVTMALTGLGVVLAIVALLLGAAVRTVSRQPIAGGFAPPVSPSVGLPTGPDPLEKKPQAPTNPTFAKPTPFSLFEKKAATPEAVSFGGAP